jgi:hypothetical protein
MRKAMRKLALAAMMSIATALPLLGGAIESRATEGPWCHTFGGSQGPIENCGFRTLEVCRAEIPGNGGSCSPNPRWHADRPDRARRHG